MSSSPSFFQRQFIRFLLSPYFWLNLVGVLIATLLFAWLVKTGLSAYTHHGESIAVPDLRGLTVEQVERMLESKNLRYAIANSSYDKDVLPGAILDQDPPPMSRVKESRRIYLTINATSAPMVGIPNIIYNSLENALIQLESAGLAAGEKRYVPDPAKNAVLDIKLRGVSVEPGTKVPKGTPIELVLGNGVGNTTVTVPNVVGLTYSQARVTILGYQLNVGAMVRDTGITDLNDALVYRQVPDPAAGETTITIGEPIDIWVRENPAFANGRGRCSCSQPRRFGPCGNQSQAHLRKKCRLIR